MSDKPDGQGLTADLVPREAWAAVESDDKTIGLDHNVIASEGSTFATYTVPAGKTFYATEIAFSIHAPAGGTKNIPKIGVMFLASPTINQYIIGLGGNGGGSLVFVTPVPIAAGVQLWVIIENWSEANAEVSAHVRGYEV